MSQKRMLKVTPEHFFFVFYLLVTSAKAMGFAASEGMFLTILSLLSYLFVLIKFLYEKWTLKETVLVYFLLMLGIIIWFFSKRAGIMISIATIVAAKNINIKKMFIYSYRIRVIGFVLVVIFSYMGIMPMNGVFRYDDGILNERFGLGYGHPNMLFASFFIIFVIYMYIHFNELKIIHYLVWGVLSICVYRISFTRTGMVVMGITMFLCIMLKISKIERWSRMFVPYTSWLFSLVSILGGILVYKSELVAALSELMSGRLVGTYLYMKQYPLTLFGTTFEESSFFLDNGYIKMLYQSGIIVFCLFNVGMFLVLKKYSKENKTAEILMILAFLIYGISEEFMSNIFMNVSLIFLSDIVFGQKSKQC